MRPLVIAVAAVVLPLSSLASLAQQPAAPPPPSVRVGQAAPDFSLRYLAKGPGDKVQPQTVSLSDFKGKNTVILAFFPAAFSPG